MNPKIDRPITNMDISGDIHIAIARGIDFINLAFFDSSCLKLKKSSRDINGNTYLIDIMGKFTISKTAMIRYEDSVLK
jgi:hypothetical protein